MSREIFGISTGILNVAIKSLRARLGWSQEKLARELGCSTAAVQNWENRGRRPNLVAVQKMKDLCPTNELRELFMQPSESGIGNLKSPPPISIEPKIEEPAYVRNAPGWSRRFREMAKIFREAEEAARNGDRGAEEALRNFLEMWANKAYMLSSPERPRGRKALLNKEAIQQRASVLDDS